MYRSMVDPLLRSRSILGRFPAQPIRAPGRDEPRFPSRPCSPPANFTKKQQPRILAETRNAALARRARLHHASYTDICNVGGECER